MLLAIDEMCVDLPFWYNNTKVLNIRLIAYFEIKKKKLAYNYVSIELDQF